MRVVSVFAAVVAVLVLGAPAAHAGAAEERDPYLDAIAPESTIPLVNGADLLGAPDDRFATIEGRRFRFLLLDLGAGEEGVGDLEVRYHNPQWTFGKTLDVTFVDRNGRDLGWTQMLLPGTGTQVSTARNPSTRPYRYVRIMTSVHTVDVDSMKAAALA